MPLIRNKILFLNANPYVVIYNDFQDTLSIICLVFEPSLFFFFYII